MKRSLIALLMALMPFLAFTQSPFEINHQLHLQQLGSAKDSLYNTILQRYGKHLQRQPEDYKAHLERCRFIENAYYDSYEDYNPNYDIAQACADTVLLRFPNNPEVLLYPTGFLYGDTLGNYLHHLEKKIDSGHVAWSQYRWEVYHQLAQYYQHDNDNLTVHYGEMAIAYNDTLDASLLLARSYRKLSRDSDALDALLRHVDSTDAVWSLNEKGKLLMELGASSKAIEAFRMASSKNSNVQNGAELALAMINNGLIEEARNFLVKEVEGSSEWNASQALSKLFLYDVDYGRADSAAISYRRFAEKDFYNDVFGIYRMRMVAKAPMMGWTFTDIGHVLLFILLLVLVIILPYLWILPIHYYGEYRRQQGKLLTQPTFQWGMRHLWIASSIWLASDVLALLIFDYPSVTAMFLDNTSFAEPVATVSKTVANTGIFFCVGLLVGSIALLRREDFEGFLSKIRSNGTAIGVGIMLAIGLKFGLGLYISIFRQLGVDFSQGAMVATSITDNILSINKFYNPLLGFMFVVLFAPFYEEILFRGVFLSACQKNVSVWVANLLQASVFALAHQSLIYFPFYLAFGLIAGHYTRKSGSLITGTSMHMMNNAFAFFYLLSMKP